MSVKTSAARAYFIHSDANEKCKRINDEKKQQQQRAHIRLESFFTGNHFSLIKVEIKHNFSAVFFAYCERAHLFQVNFVKNVENSV